MRFNEFVTEGIHDPAIFKAVFVIGGPGSGKSTISDMLALPSLGFVNINSDIALTYLMNKNKLKLDMPPEEKEKREVVRGRAKEITSHKMSNAIEGRLGIYIDGTGEDFSKIDSLNANLLDIGYETFLVVVYAPLELAKQRNAKRERKVPEDILEKKWYGVQKNLNRFLRIFPDHSFIRNEGSLDDIRTEVKVAYKQIMKWSQKPVDHQILKTWMDYRNTNEAAYTGNIGAMEMIKFFQIASPELKAIMKELIAKQKYDEAWKLLKEITGINLKEYKV